MEGMDDGQALQPAVGGQAPARAGGQALQPADGGQEPAPAGEACPCCARHKRTPRSEELQRDVKSRLNRIIGQLKGVQAMLDDNRYCGDVLTQLAAAQSALKSVSCKLLEEHIQTCVVEQIREGDEDVVPELVQLIRKFS